MTKIGFVGAFASSRNTEKEEMAAKYNEHFAKCMLEIEECLRK